MTKNESTSKPMWQFPLLALSGGGFWVLYFSYYVIINFSAYVAGSLCNLGIFSGLICESVQILYSLNSEGEATARYIIFVSLFIVLLIIRGIFRFKKNTVLGSVDYFDLFFKAICIILFPVDMFESAIKIISIFTFFLIIHFSLITLGEIFSRKFRNIIKNLKQDAIVITLFVIFGFIGAISSVLNEEIIRSVDWKSYVDCCKEEALIGGIKFSTVKNSPICLHTQIRREEKPINGERNTCKIDEPIKLSLKLFRFSNANGSQRLKELLKH